MNEIYNKKWYRRKCFACKAITVPVNLGVINEIHGYKLNCPKCGAFIGWGGKNKEYKAAIRAKKDER